MSRQLQKIIMLLLLSLIIMAISYPESIMELKGQNNTYLIFFIVTGGSIVYIHDRIFSSRKFRDIFFRKFDRKIRKFIIINFSKIEMTLVSIVIAITLVLAPKESLNLSLLQIIAVSILFGVSLYQLRKNQT